MQAVVGQLSERREQSLTGEAQQGGQLRHQNDQRGGVQKAGDHRVGDEVGDHAEPQRAEQELDNAGVEGEPDRQGHPVRALRLRHRRQGRVGEQAGQRHRTHRQQ